MLRKPAVFYSFMRTGEIKFQKAVMARGFQGPRQQPLCRLTDGQIRDEDRRLQSAGAEACDRHLAHLHRHHVPGAKVDKRLLANRTEAAVSAK